MLLLYTGSDFVELLFVPHNHTQFFQGRKRRRFGGIIVQSAKGGHQNFATADVTRFR